MMQDQYTRYLVPADSYGISGDKRLLIPFTSGDKIGFFNRMGDIIVKPQYAIYYGECYDETDFVRVGVIEPYGVTRSDGSVSAYYRYLFGLMDYTGRLVLPVEYHGIKPALGNKRLYTIATRNGRHTVVTVDGDVIVPFGNYDYIGGFDNGYARVKKRKVTNERPDCGAKWGIINEKGEEVLPVEYDNIWNFYGKGRADTNIVKDGNTTVYRF